MKIVAAALITVSIVIRLVNPSSAYDPAITWEQKPCDLP